MNRNESYLRDIIKYAEDAENVIEGLSAETFGSPGISMLM